MNESSANQKASPKLRRRGSPYRALLGLAGVLAIGTIAAACGSGAASSTTTTTSPTNTTQAPAPAGGGTSATATAVDMKSSSNLGTILVDGKGFTLYRLNKDSMNKSACNTACAAVWPPLMAGSSATMAGSGVSGLGTISVPGGMQVTYHGMPLYTFTGDTSPGQTHGQGLTDTWGTWFVVVTKAPAGGGATTTTAPSGGGPAF
jgi:predicted lipoprotein with Yx(FWY)xxD motif